MKSVKDSIRAGLDALIKGEQEAAEQHFKELLPVKSRAILHGEDDSVDEPEESPDDLNLDDLENVSDDEGEDGDDEDTSDKT